MPQETRKTSRAGRVIESLRDTAVGAPGYLSSANARLGRSYMGRAFQRGTMESFGFYHEGTVNKGFLGLGPKPMERLRGMPTEVGKVVSRRGKMGLLKWGGTRLGAAAPLIGTAFMAYSGYQQEGVWGAAKGVAESAAYSTAWHAGAGLVGTGALITAGVVAAGAAGAFGYYRFGEAAQASQKRRRDIEMGSADMDLLGNMGTHTARARAMAALNNSHINARIAIGNEALLTHSSFR